jgi:tRNA nucleotidyltransferase (CCA-adding enzyme)
LEIFLVGGAVRDFLLASMKNKLQTTQAIESYWATVEKDWVVVGANQQQMLQLGFRQVGKSFPVFLHPHTQEEYALARTERKTAKGYTGFECYALPDVTLEEDLRRRDLTINAIAMRFPGKHFLDYELIDPYGGVEDLKAKLFRHVSLAFAEDPVRILRAARLAARFNDFQVAPTTCTLMKEMVSSGEVDALVPERVWQEWYRSLKEQSPWRFFEILEMCSAKKKLFPDLGKGALKRTALITAIHRGMDDAIRLAIELYDVSQKQLRELINRYRIPHHLGDLSLLVTQYYPFILKSSWSAEEILWLLEKTDALRRQERFKNFVKVCDLMQDIEERQTPVPPLIDILEDIMAIDNRQLLEQGFQGEAFAKALRKVRLEKIGLFMQKKQSN